MDYEWNEEDWEEESKQEEENEFKLANINANQVMSLLRSGTDNRSSSVLLVEF
jgi:hypothetical protein